MPFNVAILKQQHTLKHLLEFNVAAGLPACVYNVDSIHTAVFKIYDMMSTANIEEA